MPPTTTNLLHRVDRLTRVQIESYRKSYPSALHFKASLSSGKNTSGETLASLDEWYQTLPPLKSISDLENGIKGKEELVKLMRWKLSREKFRPTLIGLLASNSALTCREVLIKAAQFILSNSEISIESSTGELLRVVQGTMRILCELKGVGPATSSAIVASWVEYGVFQSDELVMNLRGVAGKIDYSWGFYNKFYAEAIGMVKELSKEGKVDSGRDVERVAWSMFYSPPTPASISTKEVETEEEKQNDTSTSAKRKSNSIKPKVESNKEQAKPRRMSKRIRSK